MTTLLIIIAVVFLILRRTRFRNNYPVMSEEWQEMQQLIQQREADHEH